MSESTQAQDSNKILKNLSPSRIIIPTLIGLAITAYMFYQSVDMNTLAEDLQKASIFWLIMVFITLFIRDAFYIYRIRYLTDKQLTWKGSFFTIMLWEFASAISPSAVGGTAIASFIITKEGISFGKSLAYVLVSAVLDNLFFIIIGAVILLFNFLGLYPESIFPSLEGFNMEATTSIQYVFYTSYIIVTIYTALMVYGLFFKPHAIRWLFVRVTSFWFLKRFRKGAVKQGNELVLASEELKGKPAMYWIRGGISTFFVWSARYLIVNCLIAAFVSLSLTDHSFIFSRHLILWVVLLLGFTPGAAGIAEISFQAFFFQFIGTMGLVTVISVLWRVVTYYPYLAFGAIFLPQWIKRVFAEAEKREVEQDKVLMKE